MTERFNGSWADWRIRFVTGGDEVTLRWLSEQPGAPSYSSLRKRSAPKCEDWDEQRKNYRRNKGTLAAIDPDVKAVAAETQKIIDTAEMMTRHMKAFRLAGSKGIAKLSTIDPERLSVKEALDLLKWAVDGERLTEGLATQRQAIDLSGMSEAELEKLANGG